MNMKDLNIVPAEPHHFKPDIKTASNTVDIDLEKPIDISQMLVHECSVMPVTEGGGRYKFHRKTELRGFDDADELIITITRISEKRPKPLKP